MQPINQDYKGLYQKLYDPAQTGIEIIRGIIPEDVRAAVVAELRENRRNFVERPHKYGTTVQELSSWTVERAALRNYSALSFVDSKYAELSKTLHAQMDQTEEVDEVIVSAGHYNAGSVGIGPHIDNSYCVNFIVIFILSGSNDFCTADDKKMTNELRYKVNPGDCVLMRGPRSVTEREMRPVHYVLNIKTERFNLSFREINHAYLHQVSRNNQFNI